MYNFDRLKTLQSIKIIHDPKQTAGNVK